MKRIHVAFGLALLLSPCLVFAQEIDDDADYLLVPGGKRVHRSCVHEVPSGARVDVATDSVYVGDQLVAHYSACPYAHRSAKPRRSEQAPLPDTTGWVENTNQNARPIFGQSWFNYLWVGWYIPIDPPSYNWQTIFLFPSFTSSVDESLIMQPVLAYGYHAGCGVGTWCGPWWTVTNYILQGSNVYHDAPQQVYSYGGANAIEGVVIVDPLIPCGYNGSNCTWHVQYRTGYWGSWSSWREIVVRLPTAPNEFQSAVLEVYRVSSCNHLPASPYTPFWVNALAQAGPNYNNYNGVTPALSRQFWPVDVSCGFDVQINGNWAYLYY